MANQMIALQARNPQLPDPARQTAQMANMMNAAAQQRASQLQGQRIRQEMEYETELQAPKLAEASAKANSAQLTFVMDFYKKSADSLLNSSTPEQAVARGERLKSMFPVPALQAQIDETIKDLVSDPSQFQAKRKEMLINTLDAKDQLAVEHSDIFDADGNLLFKESSKVGAFPTRLTPGVVTDLPSTATRPTPAPRATPTAGAGTSADMRATQGANTTPQDLINQGMDPNNIPSGMPTSRPVSFNQSDMGGPGAVQMTPEVMSRIVDSAFETGVMAQVDFDQLLASQPPQNKQALMDAFRQAKITLQADAPSLADSAMGQQQMAANPVQRPQAGFAVMRGPTPQSRTANLGGDMPMMRNTEAQYQVGQQVKGRNPNLSPYPGSAQVPLSRVAGEAEARRETPAQIKARKAAELQATEDFEEANKGTRLAREREKVFEGERAKKDAAFVDSYSDATTKGRTTLNVIDQMIGDARIEKGKLVVPKGGRRPHPGFEGVVGMGVPGVRFIPGTQAASFDALFRQAEGGAFLQAYESLRGTGQITEIEGTKATSALTRMERSQSEAEFVKAAREFADVIRGAVDRADKRYTTLTGKAPPVAAPRRKTPTKGSDGWGKAKVVGN